MRTRRRKAIPPQTPATMPTGKSPPSPSPGEGAAGHVEGDGEGGAGHVEMVPVASVRVMPKVQADPPSTYIFGPCESLLASLS